jgi:phosphoribosylaminoimidazole-succinocarboxamide synthase
LPASALMDLSKTYLNIAEKVIGKKIILSNNPKAEIVEILREQYGLVDE